MFGGKTVRSLPGPSPRNLEFELLSAACCTSQSPEMSEVQINLCFYIYLYTFSMALSRTLEFIVL